MPRNAAGPAEVAEQSLAQRDGRRQALRLAGRECTQGIASYRGDQGARAEIDEERRAGEADGRERRLRPAQQRRDARARGERPGRLAESDADRGECPAPTAAEQRVADREGRVLSGRNDDERGDAEERPHRLHHDEASLPSTFGLTGECAVMYAATTSTSTSP